jgi:hypothetical protein
MEGQKMRTLAIAFAAVVLSSTTIAAQTDNGTVYDQSNGCPHIGNTDQFLGKGANICVRTAVYSQSQSYWELLECGTNQVSADVEPYVWKNLGQIDPSKIHCTYHYPNQW